MPPKAKFTCEEIVNAAFAIARQEGLDAITARRLGADLGSSARPIFSVFSSMDEVIEATKAKMIELFNSYIQHGLNTGGFKGSGKDYIQFAIDEPVLFRELFMRHDYTTTELGTAMATDDNFEPVIDTITAVYGTSRENAKLIYQYMFIVSHGIATLCASNMCKFTEEEIDQVLTIGFKGVSSIIRG